MQYLDIRNDIFTGDLIAFRNNSLFARLIRMYTASDYSHVGVAVRIKLPLEDSEGVYIVDSHARTGFRIRRLSTFKTFDWIPITRRDNANDILQWTSAAASYIGKRIGVYAYGWSDIIRAAVGIPMKDDTHQTCQEFVYNIYTRCVPGQAYALSTSLDKLPQPQSPRELIEVLKQAGATVTYTINV